MTGFREDHIEEASIETLKSLGWTYLPTNAVAPDGATPQRGAYSDVILSPRLERAVEAINPHIPPEVLQDALRQVLVSELPSLVEENRRIHRLITDGIGIEYRGADGRIVSDTVWLIDFDNVDNNDWLALNQFTVIQARQNRRPDVVLFVNGLPLAVLELKNPTDENATLDGAFNQLQTYKHQISDLFRSNAVLVTSDGIKARIGSLTAQEERFMPWRTIDGYDHVPPGLPEQDTLLKGVFDRELFLELIRDFTVFGDKGDGPFKIVAGYHQFHGARKAVREAIRAAGPDGDRRVGVLWHTQGSGKSFMMAFIAGLAVKAPELENPTIVVITDRNDLDDQLHGTFSLCRGLLRQTPLQANSRDDLRDKLDRSAGGIIFTTIQKFSPARGEQSFPMLSDRRNVIVMADEAHRSQYGLSARLDTSSGETKYGYAHYVRQALPNASFIGFTGTPVEGTDRNTPAVFGEYIDVFDISRAVEDGATVPIYYESRITRIVLDEDKKPVIDAEIEALVEDDTLAEREKFKAEYTTIEALVGANKRIEQVATDIVQHLEARVDALGGKAMAVCMSRRICVDLYDAIIKIRPDWHSDGEDKGAIKIVMSGAASDPIEWQPHIGNKRRRDELAKRARDPKDPLKLVIVRDMWLTGFDAPCMHTMYVDKPMRGHNLMQAIARVNRVFADKPGGLVVDYIGIGQNLKNALKDYSPSDQERVGISEEEAEAALKEVYEKVKLIYSGFDYSKGITGTPNEKLVCLAGAIDWVLKWQQKLSEETVGEDNKKKAHRAYQDLILQLSTAFALAGATDLASQIKEEVGFFQAVKSSIVKSTATGRLDKGRALAVQQLIDEAVASAEIVDVLKATGLQSPDISILSDEFLDELRDMKQKNLALDALRKLLNGEIKSRQKTNIVEARAFSDRLADAIARYHANAITTLEMINELIGLAKDIQKAHARGEELDLSAEEIAFYDALSRNGSAVEAMGVDQLRVIATELVNKLRNNASVDWHKRETARAKMRIMVKRILRHYGYPPDLAEDAVRTVLEQAEVLLSSV